MESRSARSASERAPFDVVALVASAGGLEAISAVLREFPNDFPAAVVVAQHLGGQGSALATILRRRTSLPVRWAEEGMEIRPGEVVLCPSRQCLEILPDRTCALRPTERGAMDRPLDCLLHALAESLGNRALAVVLTGMGSDAAAGALALRRAGGTVIAQSEETAEQPSMPRAAAENGAASLVLPLFEIGRTVGDVMAGGRFPRPRSEVEAVETLFAGPGEARAAHRAVDWSTTPLGPVMEWPTSLRSAARTVLGSGFAMHIGWGPDFVQIYNEGFVPILGTKHPEAAGLPYRVTWAEALDVLFPLYSAVPRTGEPVFVQNLALTLERNGMREESFFTVSFSPIHDEGRVGGVLSTATETTDQVRAERRLRTLSGLTAGESDANRAGQKAIAALGENPHDAPFALLYLVDGLPHGTLCASTGLEPGSFAAPHVVELQGGHPVWPLGHVLREGAPLVLNDLAARFRGLQAGPWPEPPRAAILLPLRTGADDEFGGVLALGLSPRVPFDAKYREFLELVGTRVAANLADAQARQRERERLERIAELDRAKTEFFSNVSHEFRTPLTLMLAPLEELTHRRDELPEPMADEVATAARNARRLLALVDTLLDFSRIEEGRMRAHRAPTDLAALTTDVASLFRGAAERAGLRLVVDVAPLSERVWIDPAMWEKIVSNLLANALKFTFAGEVRIELRDLDQHVELVVRDTGVGIPAAEIPHLFKRFHRVRGTRARTQEGSGIGLALVNELVRMHVGRVRAKSVEGAGSAFTVWIPRGSRPSDETAPEPRTRVGETATALAEIADRWDATDTAPPEGALDEPFAPPFPIHAAGSRMLVVDDNADLRDYLRRLLGPHWSVETAADGAEALGRMRDGAFDLVLTDVMMPNLDGFGLLRAIRSDERLKTTPVVLLTARAGEEAAIKGLLAGADDYLVKPFSARELVARLGAQIELARVRGRAQELSEFLVRFSDAIRGLGDPHTVAQAACRLVAERLGVERAYWTEIDWTTREYVVGAAFHVPGAFVIQGRFPLNEWEPFTASHLAGRPVVVDDAQMDARIPLEVKAGYAQIGVGADLAVPITSDGRLSGTFAVNQRLPRRWTPEEVALVENVASRCWAEVERARAEMALRDSEARLRVLVASLPGSAAFVFDSDLRYRLASGEALADAGIASEDLVGKSVFEAMPPELSAQYAPKLREALAGEAFEHEHASHGRSFVSRGAPLRNAVGAVYAALVVSYDITDRKRAERVLRESEERQAFLLRLSDALRAEPDADATANRAIRMLADQMRLDHCYITSYRPEDDRADFDYQVGNGSVATLPDSVRLSDFPEAYEQVRHKTFVFDDDFERPGLSEAERANSKALGMRAMLASTARKGKTNPLYSLVAVSSRPRRWTPGEIALIEEAAERTWTAVERARAEASLRESEERQTFLLRLSDVLRTQVGATDLKAAAMRALGERLDVSRAQYHACDPSGEYYSADGVGYANGLPLLELKYRIDDFGTFVNEDFAAGRPFRSDDLTLDPRPTAEERAAYRFYGIRAGAGVPLIRAGKLVAILAVHDVRPRHWTDAEMELIRETAERIWMAVERTYAEEALRESEEKYRGLFNEMDEAYAVVEILGKPGGWSDFRFLEVNTAFVEHTGMPYPVGRTATDLLGTPNPRWAEVYGRVAETGEALRIEEREATLDRTFDLNVFRLGGPGSRRVAVLFTDVTERKRAQATLQEANERLDERVAERTRELRESEARFRALVEAIAQTVWTTDASGFVVEDSPSWRAFTGQTFDEWKGYGWTDAVHPDDREFALRNWRESVEADRPVDTRFRLWHAPSETWRLTHVRAVALRNDDGTIRGWVGTNTDLT